MNARSVDLRLSCCLVVLAVGVPCPAAPPEVAVSRPVVREVADYEDFTGRLDAAQTVDLRARVTGYLDKIDFRAGATVKRGDVLFEIDPRPYQAELDKAQAEVARAEARLKRLSADFERAKKLLAAARISAEEYDKIVGDREEAEATLRVAQAAREVAALNLGFTRVTAPLGGKVGAPAFDAGNLVVADSTRLATLVSVEPVHAFFDVDERTLLRLLRAKRAGNAGGGGELPVAMALPDEKDFPHQGKVAATDNRVDPSTGTMHWRAVFANPDGLLVPGMFVRVRLTTSAPYQALLVPEGAVESRQGQKFVLVVDRKGTVESRPVTPGARHGDLVVVQEGLTAADRVVVDKRDKVHPGMTVKPKEAAIPEPPGTPRDKRDPGKVPPPGDPQG